MSAPEPAPRSAPGAAGLAIRDRSADDLPALLRLLQRTHEHDGYPVRQSVVHADWLAAPGELLGAVALADERVVGHVALHPADNPQYGAARPQWQHATGRDAAFGAAFSRSTARVVVRETAPSLVVLPLMFMVGVALGYRALRVGVVARGDVLEVRNNFRCRTVARRDIEGFRRASPSTGGFPTDRAHFRPAARRHGPVPRRQ